MYVNMALSISGRLLGSILKDMLLLDSTLIIKHVFLFYEIYEHLLFTII